MTKSLLCFNILLIFYCCNVIESPTSYVQNISVIQVLDSLDQDYDNTSSNYTSRYYQISKEGMWQLVSKDKYEQIIDIKAIEIIDKNGEKQRDCATISSESGDWRQSISLYYKSGDEVFALKNDIFFFESGCLDEEVLEQRVIYSQDTNWFKKVDERLLSPSGLDINLSDCDMNYPHELNFKDEFSNRDLKGMTIFKKLI